MTACPMRRPPVCSLSLVGQDGWETRLATSDDAGEVARLLHDFNTEFDTPSPGTEVLASRLRVLLAGDETFAILAGSPAVAVALITLRPNVWYTGKVALLDELYVVPSLRGCGIGSAIVEALLSISRARRSTSSRSTSTRATLMLSASTSDTGSSGRNPALPNAPSTSLRSSDLSPSRRVS